MLSRRLVILVLAASFVAGCEGKLHKDYGFKRVETKTDSPLTKVRFLGKDRKIDSKNSVRGSPYELWLSIYTPDISEEDDCFVWIEKLELKSLMNDALLSITQDEKIEIQSSNDGYVAFKIFKGLSIPYHAHTLKLTTVYNSDCQKHGPARSVELEIETKYEERKITVWDMLMGV